MKNDLYNESSWLVWAGTSVDISLCSQCFFHKKQAEVEGVVQLKATRDRLGKELVTAVFTEKGRERRDIGKVGYELKKKGGMREQAFGRAEVWEARNR